MQNKKIINYTAILNDLRQSIKADNDLSEKEKTSLNRLISSIAKTLIFNKVLE